MSVRILVGDALDQLRLLPADSVHCCVTSPPYYGLRDYGMAGQIGLEPTPDEYIAALVAVFREVRRVLRKDGTLWLNIGDSYAGGGGFSVGAPTTAISKSGKYGALGALKSGGIKPAGGVKPKDLLGIPWMLAFALRADGWYLRQDIIWSKPNPMPESVTDRCTKAHEYIFMLSKSERYFFEADAIKELAVAGDAGDFDGGPQKLLDGSNANAGRNYRTSKIKMPDGWDTGPGGHGTYHRNGREKGKTVDRGAYLSDHRAIGQPQQNGPDGCAGYRYKRNKRSVWTVATSPFAEAHFATFPPALIEPTILAGCPRGGTALDPFAGAGTTALVADRLGRDAILIELNPLYAAMAERRIYHDGPLFADVNLSPLKEIATAPTI